MSFQVAAVCSPMRQNFVFCKLSKSNNERVCCCSFFFTVLLIFRFPCFHANQWTMLRTNQSNKHFYLACRCCPGLGLGQVFPNFLWPCTPFGIWIDEHVGLPLKFLFLWPKRLRKITKTYLPISMILKIIFIDECINISKWHILYVNIFFPSITNLKCTPSDRKCSPRGTCIPVWKPLV